MQTLEGLSRRMATLGSIRNVVRAMKMLAAVNAAPCEQAATSIARYHATVLTGMQALLHQSDMPDQARPEAGSRILLVFGSDHGLCGGYNETIAEAALDAMQRGDTAIHAVGARLADALESRDLAMARRFTPPASVDGIGRLAGEILIALDEARAAAPGGEIAVTSIHMHPETGNSHAPHVRDLLPLDPRFIGDLRAKPWRSRSLPMGGMPAPVLFGRLIRNHLFASLFGTAAQAMASENAARLALMQRAEQSIDDRLSDLMASTRAARQSEITSELLDVISGFEALRDRRDCAVADGQIRRRRPPTATARPSPPGCSPTTGPRGPIRWP